MLVCVCLRAFFVTLLEIVCVPQEDAQKIECVGLCFVLVFKTRFECISQRKRNVSVGVCIVCVWCSLPVGDCQVGYREMVMTALLLPW